MHPFIFAHWLRHEMVQTVRNFLASDLPSSCLLFSPPGRPPLPSRPSCPSLSHRPRSRPLPPSGSSPPEPSGHSSSQLPVWCHSAGSFSWCCSSLGLQLWQLTWRLLKRLCTIKLLFVQILKAVLLQQLRQLAWRLYVHLSTDNEYVHTFSYFNKNKK